MGTIRKIFTKIEKNAQKGNIRRNYDLQRYFKEIRPYTIKTAVDLGTDQRDLR